MIEPVIFATSNTGFIAFTSTALQNNYFRMYFFEQQSHQSERTNLSIIEQSVLMSDN